MPAQIPANGGQPQKPTKSAALYTGRFFYGLNTNRSPLRSTVTAMMEKFYGGSSNDALIGGLNTEISNRLTLCRRPGNPVYTNPTSDVASATFDDVTRFEAFHLLGPTTEDIDVMIDTIGTNGGDEPSLWTGLDATGTRGTFPGGSKKQLVFQKTVAQQAFMESVGNTLFFGDGAEQRKWLQTVTTWASIPAAALSAGQYPYFTTYIVDSNFAIQQLIATVLHNTGASGDVTITTTSGVSTVVMTFASGAVVASGLVSGTATQPTSGTPVDFFGYSTVTQLNGAFGYVTAISGDQVTITLVTSVAAHSVTADSGYMVLASGGTPTKGGSEPTWSTEVLVPAATWPYPYTGTPSTSVLTIDGTALWICRSKTSSTQAAGIFNWGIKGPTGVLAKVSPNVGSGSWQPNTYYSLDGVLIDSNGNLQQVTTPGTGGATTPSWSSTVGVTTSATGGTAVWTCIQLAASLTYASATIYCPEHVDSNGNPVAGTGQYVTKVAGGQSCLYQLQPNIQPQIVQQGATPSNSNMATGDYVDLWFYDTSSFSNPGLFKPVPATTTIGAYPDAAAAASVNSLIFNPGPDPNEEPMVNATLNQAGEITGTTTPWGSANQRYSMVALFSILITPEFMVETGGQCQLLISHDDGMVIGCAQSNVTWAGPQTLNGQSTSALNGFALIGGNNVNGSVADTGIITFPNAGTFDFEIDYFQWENAQTLVVQMNGFTPPPTVGPYNVTSCANASAGSTVYAGTFPVGVASPVGQTFDVEGFVTNAGNNGYFKCTAATTTHLTLSNANGIAETHAAVATCKSIRTLAASAAPSFPSWGTGSAPAYPSVTEKGSYPGNGYGVYAPTGGTATWANHGPAADFVWKANQSFTDPDDVITDTNQNQEAPYRTGYTSTTQPTWAKTLNALTTDNPNLIWINEGPQAAPTGTNLLTAATGWMYGVSLVNSLDDTESNMSQFSPTTGPVTNAAYIQLPAGYGLPPIAQIDPQADYVNIYRTDDGGATPLLVPGVDNSGYTIPLNDYLKNGYQDSTPDTGLNIELQGAMAGENTPPAIGAINMCYHLNRIFYSIGNVVYWTTGPAAPSGNGLNGTSPLNFDQMPSLVKRFFPTSIGLLVFTISDVYIIPGQGTTSNPIQPGQPYLPGVGILSYNALDNCGTIIGILTTDRTLMMIDPGGGFIDAGQPIGNIFGLSNPDVLGQNWEPSSAYLTWYVNGEDQGWYLGDGQTGWYRLCATPAPESGYSWSPFAQIAGGTSLPDGTPSIQAVQSIEVQPGIKRLLTGPYASGQILARSSLAAPVFTDGTSSYEAYADAGSLVLVSPGQVAGVNFVTTESVRVGNPMKLGVLMDEMEPYTNVPFTMLKQFEDDPPNQRRSRSVYAQRFYMSEDETIDAICRNMQIRFYWGFDTAQNELMTYTVYGSYFQEN
jgi:hypothetical protein